MFCAARGVYIIDVGIRSNLESFVSTTNRADAQQRADDIRVFHVELQRLERIGMLELGVDQRDAVRAHHDSLLTQLVVDFDIDRDSTAKRLSLGMRIASMIGALALAASIFFLFYQFWGVFTPTVQTAILIVASLSAFLLAVWTQSIDSSGYFAKLAAAVALMCFVLNIAMIGQIFNITPSDKALLPWAAFALLLAYAFDLRLLLIAGLGCLIAYIAARVGVWSGMYWIHFGERPENFFPAAFLLFALSGWIDHRQFVGFASTYRIVAILTLFLPMLALAHWGEGTYLALDSKIVEGLYQSLGFVGTAVTIWYGLRRQWPGVVNSGVALFIVFLYTKLFDWWWDAMPKYLFFFLLGLIAVLLLMVLQRFRNANLVGVHKEGVL